MFFWLVVCLKCPQDAFQQRIGETYRITDRYGAEKVTLFNPETHGVGVSLPAANGCSDKREPSQPRNELETLSATDRHRSRRWPSCAGSVGGNQFSRAQHHRADQSRLQQRRIFCPVMPRREGQSASRAGLAVEEPLRPRLELLAIPLAIRRQLFVANQPVGPEVG